MKRFTAQELAAKAKEILKAHNQDVVFATEDGEVFLGDGQSKSLAYDHNGKNVKGTVTVFKKEDLFGKAAKAPAAEEEQQQPATPAADNGAGNLEEAIAKAKAIVGELVEKGKKKAAIRSELKKAGFEADVIAIVTSEDALHNEAE